MPLDVEDLLVHGVVGPRKWLVQTELMMVRVLGTKVRDGVANTTPPLTLVPNTLVIVNSVCTSHFLGLTTPCINKSSSSNVILVGLPNGSSIRASHTTPLPFPQIPFGARQSNIFPALGEHNLISIGQLCDHGFSALFRGAST